VSLPDKMDKKSAFIKNSLTLITGTTIAQSIVIISAPILTRIYSPEDFGVFAFYIAIISIMEHIITGKYELAIITAKHQKEALQLVALVIILTSFFSLLSLIVVLIFNQHIADLLNRPSMVNWLYFIPLAIFLSGVYQALYNFLNLKKKYPNLSIAKITQNTTMVAGQLSSTLIIINPLGLILGSLIGHFFAVLSLIRSIIKFNYFKNFSIDKKQIKYLLKKYIKFPKFEAPATLLNSFALQSPNLLLPALFGATFAGFFYLTQKVIQAPIVLITYAISDVYRQRVADTYHKTGNVKSLFLKTALVLFLISLPPAILLFYFAEDLFSFIFGAEWVVAAEYVKILIPAVVLRFIVVPLFYIIYIVEKQHINLIGMIFLTIVIILTSLIADNHYQFIIGLSIYYTILYTVYFFIAAFYSGVFAKTTTDNKVLVLNHRNLLSGQPSHERQMSFVEFFQDNNIQVYNYDTPKTLTEKMKLLKYIFSNSINNIFISMPEFRNWFLFLIPKMNIVLDIRDGWSVAIIGGYGGHIKPNKIKGYIAKMVERFAISRAKLTITCTLGLQNYLQKLSTKKIILSYNGYSKEDKKIVTKLKKNIIYKKNSQIINAVCCGSFAEYSLKKAQFITKRLSKKYANKKVVFKIIGADIKKNKTLLKFIKNNNIKNIELKILPRMEKIKMLEQILKSDIAITVLRDPEYDLGTKIYQYILCGVPIFNYFDDKVHNDFVKLFIKSDLKQIVKNDKFLRINQINQYKQVIINALSLNKNLNNTKSILL